MTIPYTFAGATTAIPLAQLDANFASPITLGNVAMTLSNTYTSIGNLTLTNVTVSSGNVAVTNANVTTLTATNDASISGLTVGKGSGSVNTNTVLGYQALASNSSAGGTIAIGYQALNAMTTGDNCAVGYQSMLVNTTGATNTTVGTYTLKANTTGSQNVAMGRDALQANTTASNNTAVGFQAGYSNTTGTQNTFIGTSAGYSNTAYGQHTVIGFQAGYYNVNGNINTFLGWQAGFNSNPSVANTNSLNCFLGYYAGWGVTTGVQNTFVGGNASGYLMTTGNGNTILGNFSGNSGGLDIRTATNYIVLSDGAGNPRQTINGSGQVAWGTSTIDGYLTLTWRGQSYVGMVYNNLDTFGSSANIRFKNNGSTVGDITSTTSATSYNTSSDYRLKEDVQPMINALATIAQLKPCTYKWKVDGSNGQGFIAHELQAVVPDCVTGEKDAVNEDGSIKPQGIDTSFLVATLTAAIQELKAEFDAYKTTHP